jgi:MtN3 and saliva related transmembrane protein
MDSRGLSSLVPHPWCCGARASRYGAHPSYKGRRYRRGAHLCLEALLGSRMTDALGALAATAGIMMGLAPLMQLRRMMRRRSVADVSVAFFGLMACGNLAWLSYGLALSNVPVVLANSISAVTAGLTVGIGICAPSSWRASSDGAAYACEQHRTSEDLSE